MNQFFESNRRENSSKYELGEFDLSATLNTDFGEQVVRMGSIGSLPYGLHVSIQGSAAWFDCHNLMTQERAYRPHLYVSHQGGSHIPVAEKIQRLQNWEEAILVADSLMYDPDELTIESLRANIHNFKIPRAVTTHHATGINSLRAILKGLGAEERGELVLPWSRFVEAAREGEIVQRWLAYQRTKGR